MFVFYCPVHTVGIYYSVGFLHYQGSWLAQAGERVNIQDLSSQAFLFWTSLLPHVIT